MLTKKHIGKYVQICNCLIPRWGVLKLNIEMHERFLQKERAGANPLPELISSYNKVIFHKLEELHNYNYQFN